MPRKYEPGWLIYKEQMHFLDYGDALWEPAPTRNYTSISIGDVGFIRRGRFHLLFSAGSPLGERQLGDDVPMTFEELNVGTPDDREPRPPGCLHTPTVRPVGAGLVDMLLTTLSLKHGMNFSLELTGDRGAALVTRYPTYQKDSLLDSAFETYTKRHYESWVAFARHKQYGNDLQPILVTGFDMTSDFAMAAYSNKGISPGSKSNISVPMFASTPTFQGTWRARFLPHTNHGPQQRSPPPHGRAPPPSQSRNTGSATNDYNQCVFIRYYTMCSRKRWAMFSRATLMRAGAGPHDLGSGDNKGGTFPELTARSDAEPTTSSDEEPGGHRDPTTDGTGSEPDIVVRNTSYDEEYGSWNAIADYVFQNSDATSVLMHHRDLAGIRAAEGAGDISPLLVKDGPRIVVDESGVGRIICRREPSQPLENSAIAPPHHLPASALRRPTRSYPEDTENLEGQDIDPQSYDLNQIGPVGAKGHSHTTPRGPNPTGRVERTFTSDPKREMGETWGSTEQRIALIARGSVDSRKASQLLNETFDAPDYFHILRGCSEAEAQRYINGLYEIYGNLPSDSSDRLRCLRGLRKAGGRTGLLPTSYHISPQLKTQDELPNAAGEFSDVWKAKLANDPTGPIFALKILRVNGEDDIPEVRKRFCKAVLVAKLVKHDNILAIEGVQVIKSFRFCIISEWMERGNMHTYLKNNQVTDRAELLLGVTRGLNYLHSIDVTHGDLKSSNILIDDMGNPRLTDFGFSSITMNDRSVSSSMANRGGSTRWLAPELLALSIKVINKGKAKATRPTKKSDVYSLAMVTIEIFTGRQPFYLYSDEQVILLLAKGSRPDKPVHEQFTSGMWSLTKKCWNKDPHKRPDVPKILEELESKQGKDRYKLLPGSLSPLFASRISLIGESSDTNRLV